MSNRDRAASFRELHTRRPLVLPNAWDAASARVIELAGASAIATTSAGVSWTFGRGDGQKIRREDMIDVVGRIARTVSLPVSADIEGGYGSGTVEDVADTVRAMVALGVAGINLEDSPGRDGETLLSAAAHGERIGAAREAARAAGGDLVINARTDVYLFQVGAPDSRFDAAVERARVYRAAGADCIFVPGVIDAATIGALARAIDAPLNVMAMPGAPPVSELVRLGVARISIGPAIAQVALTAVQRAARELLQHGSYDALDGSLPFGEINGMFA